MKFADIIKDLRRKSLLSQTDFAKAIYVSYSTVNRWESGKTVPNYKALKKIQEYCKINSIDFDISEDLWEEKK